MIYEKLKFIIDKNNFTIRPDPLWIKNKNWYCRVYLDSYDYIEASFINKAIQIYSANAYEFIVKNTNDVSDIKLISVDTDYIENFYKYDKNIDIALNHSGITDKDCNYLFFKDAENEIFMLFGTKEFLYMAMPIDFKTYKKYYSNFYGYWESENIDSLLQRIWNDYPKI